MADNNKDPKKNQKGFFQSSKKGDPKGTNKNTIWIFVAIAVGFLILQFATMQDGAVEVSQLRFESEMVKGDDVERLVIVNKEKVEIFLKNDSKGKPEYSDRTKSTENFAGASPADYYFGIGSIDEFSKKMAEINGSKESHNMIPMKFDKRTDFMQEILSWVLPLGIIVLIWVFIFKRMGGAAGGGGGIFSIGKSKAKLFENGDSKVKIDFTNVAGLEEAKIEVQEIVDFLKKPDKYTALGGKIPKGALLIGPPGTGKTLLAKAVAGEANVPFFSIAGSDFVEMFVGVGASRVRDLFAQAKAKAPCIIFIDEIDAVGRARSRGMNMNSNDERESTLNQLLTEMDGFDTNTGVIILAATNRSDVLDPALLRAGRFDRQINVDLPDLNEREEIFKVHLKPIKIGEGFDIAKLAKQTPGFSGADIANVCNEAALIAARHEKKHVEHQDFLDAVDRIVGGLEKKNKIITKSEKKTIAYHEAGHATVSWMLEHAHPLIKVTIVPRGQALGAAWYQPHERQITTKEQLLDEMCATLGGRASEEINFSRISSGALNDLEKVSKQAYSMIAYLGMSDKIGNISYYDSSGKSEYTFQKPYSEKTSELIDSEVKELIDIQYKRAKVIILENKDKLVELAELLLTNEVLFTEDLIRILGDREFDDEYEAEVALLRKKNIERLKIREEKKKAATEKEKLENEKNKKDKKEKVVIDSEVKKEEKK